VSKTTEDVPSTKETQMGRVHVRVGTRYTQDAQTWVVVQVLQDGRLVVENQSGGGHEVVTREEVTAAWAEGALRFVLHGSGKAEESARTRAYTIADFHTLPEDARAEAWRRYRLIRPLLAWPPERRTRRGIEVYLLSVTWPLYRSHPALD